MQNFSCDYASFFKDVFKTFLKKILTFCLIIVLNVTHEPTGMSQMRVENKYSQISWCMPQIQSLLNNVGRYRCRQVDRETGQNRLNYTVLFNNQTNKKCWTRIG